ncbi:MAG: hypothetical protein G01um101416_1052 [Microgenomates group bacterium Gr01-1014_16]|nr:MAG: hypothetical protein G01um101416_1052 [Microgenomates group bacterium Gr01-1014_16]
MGQKELLKLVGRVLEKFELKYMITGAWSVIFYGRVRTSHDLDFIVEVEPGQVDKMKAALKEMGESFWWQEDAVDEAARKKSMFNVVFDPTGDKIDFWILKAEEFDAQRFERRVKVKAWEQPMFISSAEDTILQKLRWYETGKIEKHLIDAAFVWQIQATKLDQAYIKKWAKKLGVEKYLVKLNKINIEEQY